MHLSRNFFPALLATLFAAAVTWPALPASADDELAQVPASFELDNGLEIVVIPDRRAPVVTHMIWYKAGSADEPPGKSGIAHFLEHLMFKGTANVPAGEFSTAVAAIGGQENAFTSADYTAYYQKVSPEALGMVMRYEADRMTNLSLDEDDIAAEREVILQERRQRIDSRPGGILSEALSATVYQNHPYGTPIIGWTEEMAQLGLEDAMQFYKAHYSPDNAVLVVAGDVEAGEVLRLAGETYGKIEGRRVGKPRARPPEPEHRSERKVYYSDETVASESFRRIYLAPSYRIAEPREAEALDLLASILGGASTSRIKRSLLVDDPVAANVGASFWGGSYDMSEFSIYATPLPDRELQEIEARIDAIIDRVVEQGITEEELAVAKESLIKSAIFDRDSQTSMARLYGSVLAVDETVEDVVEWPARIRSVTVEDVNAAARKYLKPERSVTGYLVKEDVE